MSDIDWERAFRWAKVRAADAHAPEGNEARALLALGEMVRAARTPSAGYSAEGKKRRKQWLDDWGAIDAALGVAEGEGAR